MPTKPFATPIEKSGDTLVGPWRAPLQMLAAQSYDAGGSIHDDATAQKLGFRGGTIEGPTHFSQFVPLAFALWGERWLTQGCIFAHYRTIVYEGDRVRAKMTQTADNYAESPWKKRMARRCFAARHPSAPMRRHWRSSSE